MSQDSQNNAYTIAIDENNAGQRLDNYLIKHLKGVPKGHVYRIVRKGEVRVNKKRCKVQQRLLLGDMVRIPPLRTSQRSRLTPSRDDQTTILNTVIYEDDHLMIINKPAGWLVHGGSGSDYGIIETLKQAKQDSPYVELVHRLDKDTSGCLMIAKSRQMLLALHSMLSGHSNAISKVYMTLLKGQWTSNTQKVDSGYKLVVDKENTKAAQIDNEGKKAVSWFYPSAVFSQTSLMKVKIDTGRMHQIRVHAAHMNHPVAGDDKYGDFEFNHQIKKQYKLKRIFLHATQLKLVHPLSKKKLTITAPLPDDLSAVLELIKIESMQQH